MAGATAAGVAATATDMDAALMASVAGMPEAATTVGRHGQADLPEAASVAARLAGSTAAADSTAAQWVDSTAVGAASMAEVADPMAVADAGKLRLT